MWGGVRVRQCAIFFFFSFLSGREATPGDVSGPRVGFASACPESAPNQGLFVPIGISKRFVHDGLLFLQVVFVQFVVLRTTWGFRIAPQRKLGLWEEI